MQTDNKYVVRLRDAAIYHADDPFGSRPEKKLLRQGEMVLSEINLSVAPGEFVYLIGTTGSGKTTLMRMLTREVLPTRGQVSLDGIDLRRLSSSSLPYFRRDIGVVFQDYAVWPHLSVWDNVCYPMKKHKVPKDEIPKRAAYALEQGAAMSKPSVLRGEIVSIDTAWSDEYKNITVTIVVGGLNDYAIQCFRLSGEGADKLAEGDVITVTGAIKNYKGTVEFDAGCTFVK